MPISDFSKKSLSELISMSGRTAVITGAGRGLGMAISRRLAEAGAGLVLGDLDEKSAHQLATGLRSEFGVEAIGSSLDVRQESSVEALADLAISKLGTIDIWVNNAGIFPYAHLLDTSATMWDNVIEVNLRGTFLGTSAAARRMLPNDDGRSKVILNISSIMGLQGREGLTHYAASKHGIHGLTKSVARELGPLGIRVLAIAPTTTNTPGLMTRRVPATQIEAPGIEERGAEFPLKRVGLPDDVARVALFCVSDMAALMTGSVVLVDAGSLTG